MHYLLFAVVVLSAFPVIAAHYGAGARFADLKSLVTDKFEEYWAHLKKAYYESLIPAARRMTRAASWFFVVGGISGLILALTVEGVPGWVGWLVAGAALFLFFVLHMAAAPEDEVHDKATIAANTKEQQIVFSADFKAKLDTSPIILVEPWNSQTEFSVTDVTPDGFKITLDEPVAQDTLFTWRAQVRPTHEPLIQMAVRTFWPAALFALGTLIIALQYHTRSFVWLSLPFAALAILVFFQVYRIGVGFARVSANIGEYPLNTAFGFVSAILKNDAQELEKFLAHVQVKSSEQILNLFNQEDWEKNRVRRYMVFLATLIPIYQWALLIPRWEVFVGWRIFEFIFLGLIFLLAVLANQFSDEALEKGDSELVDRAEKLRAIRAQWLMGSLLTYIALTEIVTIIIVLSTVNEGFERAFEMRAHDTWSWFLSFVRGGGSIPLPTWQIGVAALLLGWLVYKYLLPSKEDTKAAKARAWAAWPLLVVCGLVGFGGLAHAAFSKGRGDRLSISGFRQDSIAAPTIHTKWFKESTAAVEIRWEKVPSAVDYQFEWRKLTDKEYTVVKELAGGFGEGVRSWEGTIAVSAGKAFLRMRAIYRAHEEKQNGKTIVVVDDRSESSADVPLTFGEEGSDTKVAASVTTTTTSASASAPQSSASVSLSIVAKASKPSPQVPQLSLAKPALPQATLAMCKELGISCD